MTSPLFVDIYRGDMDGKPDWGKLVQLGPPWHGAIVKATQGASYPLGWFREQWKAIRDVGRAEGRYGVDWFRGCYHYLEFHIDGATQADFYLRAVAQAGGWDVGDFWPIVDVELGSDKSPNQLSTRRQIIECTTAFADRVREKTGRPVMLYGNGAMRDRQIVDRMGCEFLWCPRYTEGLPREIYERAGWSPEELVLWQYSGDGVSKLKGYPRYPQGFGDDCQVSVLTQPDGLRWLRSKLWAEKPGADRWVLRHRTQGYLMDACAGGAFSDDIDDAVEFDSGTAAYEALDAADIDRAGFEAILRGPQ